jgi:hypothetical protein
MIRFALIWVPTALDLRMAALALIVALIALFIVSQLTRPTLWQRAASAGVFVCATFIALTASLAIASIAYAADTSATTVSASPWVVIVVPIAQAIAYVIVTGLVALVAALIQRYVGVRIDQATQGKLDGYIESLVGAEIAKASDNLATAQIDVKSPIVKMIVDRVAADLPAEMQALGVTPAAVAAKAAGAFGKLQAQMTTIAAPAAAAARA